MCVEGAARQTSSQHDVVDIGAGIATLPEQAAGMAENLDPDAGRVGGTRRHLMSIIISYDDRHMKAQAVDCAVLVAASRSARLNTSTKAEGGWAPETAYLRLTMKQGTPLMPSRRA